MLDNANVAKLTLIKMHGDFEQAESAVANNDAVGFMPQIDQLEDIVGDVVIVVVDFVCVGRFVRDSSSSSISWVQLLLQDWLGLL